ncbi:MAG: hypothetical protein Q7S94_11385 [Gallionella sp.]|nr:hypothetical protein [Gallionella sp.]
MKQNLNNRKPESQMEKAGLRNSAAPLNVTLISSPIFQTLAICIIIYIIQAMNFYVARIQTQDQPEKTRF